MLRAVGGASLGERENREIGDSCQRISEGDGLTTVLVGESKRLLLCLVYLDGAEIFHRRRDSKGRTATHTRGRNDAVVGDVRKQLLHSVRVSVRANDAPLLSVADIADLAVGVVVPRKRRRQGSCEETSQSVIVSAISCDATEVKLLK